MRISFTIIVLFISFVFNQELFKLSQKDFVDERDGKRFHRGEYLIILGDESLESSLSDIGGDFIEFKRSQGYDVTVMSYPDIATNQNELREYLSDYYIANPMLEYVLLVGDVTGAYAIPTHLIQSYNDADYPLDQTDYPYTFFSAEDMYSPGFFIGRWSIQDQSELLNLISRTIGYSRLIHPVTGDELGTDYLNNAMIVAGNFADTPGVAWPVTPVWTSKWLKDRLVDYNYSNIEEFYFTASNPNEDQTSEITSAWSDGVGIINYRGWGDASGWKKPIFKKEHIENLSNGWELPVVFSFVCNTGDFGNENNEACFGEKMVKTGSFINPKGAVAMIGPSDLDTDTKYNNVICADVWDHILEGRISELAPALHAGKQAVLKEFGPEFEATGAAGTANIAEFYHHVYGVLGDPSLSVWIGEPSTIGASVNDGDGLSDSFVSVSVYDNSTMSSISGVVGALIYDDELIGKGISNNDGELSIDFNESQLPPLGSEISLYLNKDQYFQKKINLIFLSDNSESSNMTEYVYNEENVVVTEYYTLTNYDNSYSNAPIYDWVDITSLGTNLELTDDSHRSGINIGFPFQYYGELFDEVTISSNGWVSFIDTDINYFWNFSIPFPIGPSGMVAPFMDDLDDDDSDNPDPLDVYYYYDVENHRFIIQWDEINNGEDNQECGIEGYTCVTETFQVIFYDSRYYPTVTGDGEIRFQYKEIHDIDNGDYDGKWGNYSTIGIESPDQNHGIQYQFRNELENFYGYAVGEYKVQDEMAILFTTNNSCLGTVDDCGVCDGAVFYLEEVGLYSNGACNCNGDLPVAYCIDNDGDGKGDSEYEFLLCEVPNSGILVLDCEDDIDNVPDNCIKDDCGVCNGGNLNKDCNGACFGVFELDCSGDCNGGSILDECGVCNGNMYQNSDGSFPDGSCDCNGTLPIENYDCNGNILSLKDEIVLEDYRLHQNFPNPFNPTTTILFNVDSPAYVTLIVTDLRGREIARLYDNKFLNKGSYDYLFDGSNLTSGIYFYTLRIGSEIFTNKMLLLK